MPKAQTWPGQVTIFLGGFAGSEDTPAIHSQVSICYCIHFKKTFLLGGVAKLSRFVQAPVPGGANHFMIFMGGWRLRQILAQARSTRSTRGLMDQSSSQPPLCIFLVEAMETTQCHHPCCLPNQLGQGETTLLQP